MKKLLSISGVVAVGLALVLLAVGGLRGTNASALTDCSVTHDALAANEQEMLELINAARTQVGLAPYVLSPNLNRAAAWMSEDMAGRLLLSHTDSLGRGAFERMPECGYANSGAAENVGVGTSTAAPILGGFMASPGHRASILNPDYVAIGIGEYEGWWTLDFGMIDDSGAPQPTVASPAPSPTPSPTPIPSPSPSPSASPPPQTTGRAIVPLVAFE